MNKKNIYKVVVIGLGNIGLLYDLNSKNPNFFASHCKTFHTHPNFKLIAGVDINKKNIEIFKKKYSLPVYSNTSECISKCNPDVIIISTNTNLHNIFLEEIINSQVKNITILCEKPISDNSFKTKKLIEQHELNKNNIFVNYMRISDPISLKIRSQIKQNYIKGPYIGCCFYNNGILNNASHLINLFQFWFGEIISGKIIDDSVDNEYDPSPNFKIEFKNARFNFVSLKDLKYTEFAFDIYSSSGKLSYRNEGKNISFQNIENDMFYQNYKIISGEKEILNKSINISQIEVANNIFNFLQSKNYSLCSAREALITLEFIENLLDRKNE